MTAMDARKDLNNERMQRTMDAEQTAAQPAHDGVLDHRRLD